MFFKLKQSEFSIRFDTRTTIANAPSQLISRGIYNLNGGESRIRSRLPPRQQCVVGINCCIVHTLSALACTNYGRIMTGCRVPKYRVGGARR